MRRRRRLQPLLPLLVLAACSDDPTAPGGQELVPLRLTANVSGTTINILVVTVSAADMPVPLIFNLLVPMAAGAGPTGIASGTLRVPPGTGRTFLVQAFDTNGDVTHEGSETVHVVRGPNPPLAITIYPRAGQVPIVVSLGSYGVLVAPGSALLDVASRCSSRPPWSMPTGTPSRAPS
jgi:hypothetical protein